MTDSEIEQVVARIASNPELLRQIDAPRQRGFIFSDNFKWLMVTIAIPLSTFLFGQWQEHVAKIESDRQQQTEAAKRDLESRLGDARNNVAAMTALLPALADSDPKKARLAMVVLEQLKNAQHSENVHLDAAITAMRRLADDLQRSSDPGDLQRGAELQEAYGAATGAGPVQTAVSVDPVSATTVDQAAAAKPRIVYVQIYGDAQRGAAEEIRELLRRNGIGAPGIEDVSGRLAGRVRQVAPQIRYFSNDDLGRATWLANNLPNVQGQAWTVVRARAGGVPAGQLELWWPFPVQG